MTDRNGEYILRSSPFDTVGNWGSRQMGMFGIMKCYLRASLPGYESSSIDLDELKPGSNQALPEIVLRRNGSGRSSAPPTESPVPRAARKAWEAGLKAMESGDGKRHATGGRAPIPAGRAAGVNICGGVECAGCGLRKAAKIDEARVAYLRGAEADPNSVTSPLLLMQLESTARNWPAAAQHAITVIEKDKQRRHPEAHIYLAAAKYQLGEFDRAAESASEALRVNNARQIPNAEYIYALILEAKRDYAAAEAHYRKYLELEPSAGNAQTVKARIANLGKQSDARPEIDVDLNVRAVGPAWVPGGMKALASIAHIEEQFTSRDFFGSYCRAIVRYTDPSEGIGIPGYLQTLRAYFAALPELASIGDQREGRTVVKLSLSAPAYRMQTERALNLLGWRVVQANGSARVKLSEVAMDVPRQRIPPALGIDEIAMQQVLEKGESYEFEIGTDDAPLMGGDAWLTMVQAKQALQGGLAEAFVRDVRLAKVYAVLSAAGPEAAAAIVTGAGLERLTERHAAAIARYGSAFAISNGAALTPGGAGLEAVWTSLAGASPANAAHFFRAVLEKDGGKLAPFYFELSRMNPASARYHLKSPEQAAAFYSAGNVPVELPLDPDGHLRYPGGKSAWEEAAETSAVFIALSKLEQARKAPLDEATVKILRRHYEEWQSLFSYFERMHGLGRNEFEALAEFAQAAQSRTNEQMGAWYALVELIVQGAEAGSMDARSSAIAFEKVCRELKGKNYSERALAILQELVGHGISLNEGVPARLLRLDAPRRASFDRVLMLQNNAGLDAARATRNDRTIVTALTAVVYASRLDPAGLLIAEDADLASRHQYVPGGGSAVSQFRVGTIESTAG